MPSVGAVTSNLNTATVAVNTTANPNDFLLVNALNGPLTITLPGIPPKNTVIAVKKVDTSTSLVTVVTTGGALINGDTSVVLAAMGATVTVQYDGGSWQITGTALINTSASTVGIPAGGTAGQMLAKNTGNNFDASWKSVVSGGGGNFPLWAGAGRLFCSPFQPSSQQNIASWGFSTGYLNFMAVQIPNPCTVTGAYVWHGSSASAASVVGIGLYADAPTAASGGPGVRLAQTTITESGAANTLYGSALSYTFTGPQLVWVGYSSSSNPFLWCTYNSNPVSMVLGTTAILAGSSATTAPNLRYSGAYTYNTMPADASTGSTAVYNGYNPLVFFTVA